MVFEAPRALQPEEARARDPRRRELPPVRGPRVVPRVLGVDFWDSIGVVEVKMNEVNERDCRNLRTSQLCTVLV